MIAAVIVITLQNHLVVGKEVVHLEVGISIPVGSRGIESHIEALHTDTQVLGPLLIRRVRVTAFHLEQNIIVGGVTDTEVLLLRIRLVGTHHLVQSSCAIRNGQREAALIRLSLNRRRHLICGGGSDFRGSTGDDARLSVHAHAGREGGRHRASGESKHRRSNDSGSTSKPTP